MIQFNLLPDVKLQYIKARRSKQLVMLISVAVAATALALLVLLFINVKLQSHHIDNLTKDIKTDTATLKKTPNIDKILTIQSQLASLPDLHQKKQAASRFFDYATLVTPSVVKISKSHIDFDATTITVDGSAPTIKDINQFVDSLKFTEYKSAGSSDAKKAFSNVVLKSFGRDEKAATYAIELSFDPAIFDNTTAITLNVPNITTTRSEIEKPPALFEQNPNNSTGTKR